MIKVIKGNLLLGQVLAFAMFALEAKADVPGDDIFGFTTPSDVGNPGDTTFANENDGRWGKRSGSYRALNSKYELGNTFAPDWWIGASLFSSYNRSQHVPDLADVNRLAFDGASFELAHRIVKRSDTNPFAISLSMEPRWGRIENLSGLPSHSFNVAFKVFADTILIPEKLFLASNVIVISQRSEDPNNHNKWMSSSAVLLSLAIAYQISPRFFVGAETRYLAGFSNIVPTEEMGHAVFAGPTMLWKITDKVAFNTTIQPQITGRSTANPALRLDLDNLEKLQFRAKLNVALQ